MFGIKSQSYMAFLVAIGFHSDILQVLEIKQNFNYMHILLFESNYTRNLKLTNKFFSMEKQIHMLNPCEYLQFIGKSVLKAIYSCTYQCTKLFLSMILKGHLFWPSDLLE